MPGPLKSYDNESDPVTAYCCKLTIKLNGIQRELQEATLGDSELGRMLGAPEVLTLGANFIQLIGAKNILDIGTFTGASALAWALASGYGAKVHTVDISMDPFLDVGLPIISKSPEIFSKIIAHEGPAIEYFDRLISEGRQNSFDFIFLDANKEQYSDYYDRSVTLLRSGGIIVVDNALWSGDVINYGIDDITAGSIDRTNKKIFADERTNSALINCGDGLHIVFKK